MYPARRFLRYPFLLFFLLFSLGGMGAEPAPYRLVLQVSEDNAARLNLALNSALHARTALGTENIQIEIVVFGPAVNTLTHFTPDYVANNLEKVLAAGVRVAVCKNAMEKFRLSPGDMLPGPEYVASGVALLVERQTAGWAYIRP